MKNIDEGLETDVILKVFEKVLYNRLLKNLENCEIKSRIHKWIASFFLGRRQRVQISGTYFSWKEVLSGIRIGIILDSLLFVICINDLPIHE